MTGGTWDVPDHRGDERDHHHDEGADLAELLDEVSRTFADYVVLPSDTALIAVTLWTAATHAQPAWENAPRLVVKSPVRQCGKTRLQEIIGGLANRVLRTVNISPAALVRSLDETDPPTVVLDEADAVFSTRRGERSEGAEDLRGILNSGHSRGWPYVRWDAAARRTEKCPTFAMACLGGIGALPDTIEDRAIIIEMRRRAPGERVRPYRSRRAQPELYALRDRLHGHIAPLLDELSQAEPDMPVEDRAADTWEPLIVLSDAAGGHWPDSARKACAVLAGGIEPDDATLGERLLADLASAFGYRRDDDGGSYAEALHTTTVLASLHAMDEAPWADYFGRQLNSRDLARLLRPYGIRSRNVRIGDEQAKGYTAEDLSQAWVRYLPRPNRGTPQAPSRPVRPTVPATLNHAGTDAGTDDSQRPSPRAPSVKSGHWDGGTDGTQGRLDGATGGTEWIDAEAEWLAGGHDD